MNATKHGERSAERIATHRQQRALLSLLRAETELETDALTSGWTYQLARWRDGSGFTSMDSLLGDPSSPMTLHKYLYAASDAVEFADPTGKFFDIVSLLSSLTDEQLEDGNNLVELQRVRTIAKSLNEAQRFYNGFRSAYDTISTIADFMNIGDLSKAELGVFRAGLGALSNLGLHISIPTITIPVPQTLVKVLQKKMGFLWDTAPGQSLIGAAFAALVTTLLGWETTSIAAAYTGVDAVMYAKSLNLYAVVEAKGGTSKLAQTDDGTQMYDRWIRARIQKAINDNSSAVNTSDYGRLVTQPFGPFLATVISTDLRGGSPYVSIKVQTSPGVQSWGPPFE